MTVYIVEVTSCDIASRGGIYDSYEKATARQFELEQATNENGEFTYDLVYIQEAVVQ